MNLSVQGYKPFTATLTPVTYPRRVRIRYSGPAYGMRGWTSDNLPRQLSIDTLGMKDHPYDDPNRIIQIGLPDQIKYMPDAWIQLTETRQRWLFDVLCLSAYGKLYAALTSLQKQLSLNAWAEYLDDGRCFTNKSGTNTHHDYIRGVNESADDMSWEPLLTGGNWVELTGQSMNISTTYLNFGVKSYLHYEARAVDINNLPAPSAFLTDTAVCHIPTTIKPTGETGIFPQWSERAVYPLWSASGRVWIWEQLLEL